MTITRQHARNIVDSFRDKIDFGLGITDTRGIVLASTEPGRLESFHELCYTLVLSKKQNPIKVTHSADYLGATAGVCMALRSEGELVGAFSMSGEPERLFPLAGLMQAAIETALVYEMRERYGTKSPSLRESFLSALIYGTGQNQQNIESWAEQLRFDPALVRIPMLFSFGSEAPLQALTAQLKALLPEQDIIAETHDGQLFLFKAISSEGGSLLGTYAEMVHRQYRQVCDLYAPQSVSCYVGSFQSQLSAYSYACQHCFWLRRRYPEAGSPIFFYTHIEAYLFEQIPTTELYRAFYVIARHFSPQHLETLTRIIGTLDRNNYNLVSSSRELFMHKNTLAAALDRIKEYTDMNPMQDASHRKFLLAFACYLRHIEGGTRTLS